MEFLIEYLREIFLAALGLGSSYILYRVQFRHKKAEEVKQEIKAKQQELEDKEKWVEDELKRLEGKIDDNSAKDKADAALLEEKIKTAVLTAVLKYKK